MQLARCFVLYGEAGPFVLDMNYALYTCEIDLKHQQISVVLSTVPASYMDGRTNYRAFIMVVMKVTTCNHWYIWSQWG